MRVDDLDAAAILHVRSAASDALPSMRPIVLDLGCGSGAQSVRMALSGGLVYSIDSRDHCVAAAVAACKHLGISVQVTQADARCLHEVPALSTVSFDVIYCQRMLHYLKHGEALGVLAYLRRKTAARAKLYLGLSGMASELVLDYEHARRPIAGRLGMLGLAQQEKHQIREPLCLYSLDEAVELISLCGFQVERAWLSEFGNVKLIAVVGGLGVA